MIIIINFIFLKHESLFKFWHEICFLDSRSVLQSVGHGIETQGFENLNMKRDEDIQSVSGGAEAPKSAFRTDLDRIIRKQGYDSGRLFHSGDKATYTFVHGDEVISMHFDLHRHDLFVKGHRISSFEDHPNLGEFLARFKKALTEQCSDKAFLNAFDTTISRLNRT